jgi:hypothetical protein
LEAIANPKEELHRLLKQASGLSGRRLDEFNPQENAHLIPEYIDDFSPLRHLAAFNALETDIRQLIEEKAWNKSD